MLNPYDDEVNICMFVIVNNCKTCVSKRTNMTSEILSSLFFSQIIRNGKRTRNDFSIGIINSNCLFYCVSLSYAFFYFLFENNIERKKKKNFLFYFCFLLCFFLQHLGINKTTFFCYEDSTTFSR